MLRGRGLFKVPRAEREAIRAVLTEELRTQPDVAFAYVHGSFATERPFRDVDVAVYLAPDAEAAGVRAMRLSEDLEEAVSRELTLDGVPPVDVRILNRAPLGFCYQALRRGTLLFSGDESLRVPWVAGVVARYLDLQPLRRRALKEAMTAF